MFFQVDYLWPSASVTAGTGLAPDILQAMRERNLAEDSMWQAALRLPAGAVFRSDDLHSGNPLERGPLYSRIAISEGIQFALSANLENNATFFTNICFLQGGAPFSDAAKETLTLLVPHLQTALQIARRISVGDAGRDAALRSFDRARQPLVVLDRSGYVLLLNESAQDLLNTAEGISLKFGRFLFDNVTTQAAFERAMREVLTRLASDDESSVLQNVRIPRRSGRPPYAMTVVAVRRPDSRALMPDGAGCMVLIYDDEHWCELPLERLTWLYGLTSAEARICEVLYRAGSVEACAQSLCLTRHTVRSHLKSIYRKFSVSTQSQLVQRLASSIRLVGIENGPDGAEVAANRSHGKIGQ
jgi:DNA-binding CsgD family transcriptional regulator